MTLLGDNEGAAGVGVRDEALAEGLGEGDRAAVVGEGGFVAGAGVEDVKQKIKFLLGGHGTYSFRWIETMIPPMDERYNRGGRNMVSGLAPMMLMGVIMLVVEGIPKMLEAARKRGEWRRIRKAHYPRMYY